MTDISVMTAFVLVEKVLVFNGNLTTRSRSKAIQTMNQLDVPVAKLEKKPQVEHKMVLVKKWNPDDTTNTTTTK